MCADCGVDLQVRGKVRGLTLKDCDRGSVVARLYRVGTSIAMLIGRDIYGDLRGSDRIEIDRLQARLIDWMCSGADGDLLAGLELWQDVRGFEARLAETGRGRDLEERDRLGIETARRILTEDFTPLLAVRLGPALEALRDLGADLADLDEIPLLTTPPARGWSRGFEARIVSPDVAAAATWLPAGRQDEA